MNIIIVDFFKMSKLNLCDENISYKQLTGEKIKRLILAYDLRDFSPPWKGMQWPETVLKTS